MEDLWLLAQTLTGLKQPKDWTRKASKALDGSGPVTRMLFLQEEGDVARIAFLNSMIDETAAAAAAAAAGGSAEQDKGGLTPVKVYYRTKEVTLVRPINSCEDLMAGLTANLKALERIDYDIELLPDGQPKRNEPAVVSFVLTNPSQWGGFMAQKRSSVWALNIKSNCKGFLDYKDADVSRVLSDQLGCEADADLVHVAHAELFPELPEDKVTAAAEKEPHCSLDKLTELAVERLRVLSRVLPMIGSCFESSRREYISAIFAPAVLLASIIHGSERRLLMVCGTNLQGSLGNGPLDYAAVFRSLMVLVLEAKTSMRQGEAHVLAQMAAALDDFVFRLTAVMKGPVTNRKRKAFEMVEMSKVTCSAVLTDAATWRILRNEPQGEGSQPRVLGSEGIALTLGQPEQLHAVCRKLISRIAHMLVLQMEQIDVAFAYRPDLAAASRAGSQPDVEDM